MKTAGVDFNWAKLVRTMQEMHESEFMREMLERRGETGSDSPMGKADCALLYALTRWAKPRVIVESGGFLGMSSSFILKALHDEGVGDATLHSVEWMEGIDHGSLIPGELKKGFRPMVGRIEDFMKKNAFPAEIDMFLHDSSHRLRHMMMEFRYFFAKLRPGGLLASHDVNMNAAFARFLAKTYHHDKIGQTDAQRTSHSYWGRLGNLGFIVKAGHD